MNPRDPNMKEKVSALNSLQELMGTILYYAWLAEKFPNVPTQAMRQKTAEETAAMMTAAEIKVQLALFERIQFHKAEVKAFIEKADSDERKYEKKQAEFIQSLNQVSQNEYNNILEKFRNLDQAQHKKALLESITMIDKRLQSLNLERNHLSETLIRLDEMIQVYDNKIQQRMDVHIEDAMAIANLIPQHHPQGQEGRQQIIDATEQLKNKKMTESEYYRSVMDVAKPFALNTPVIAARLARLEKDFSKTIQMKDESNSLKETQAQVVDRIAKLDAEVKLLNEIKADLGRKANPITEINPSDERKNVKSSTSQIGFLLANKSDPKPEIAAAVELDTKSILEKLESFDISPSQDVEETKLEENLSDFDLDFGDVEELEPLKSYEQSAEDKPYDPSPSYDEPPAYKEEQDMPQAEDKQPEDASPSNHRPGR